MIANDNDPIDGPAFAGIARAVFVDLAFRYALTEVESEPFTLRYKGPPGSLVVLWDPTSRETDAALTITVDTEARTRSFSVFELMRATDPDRARTYRVFEATTQGALRRGLEQLAIDLDRYGAPALRGDAPFIAQVIAARAEAIREFGELEEYRHDIATADDALRRKDWRRLVEIYSPHEHRLSNVERKRLEIARKRLTQS